MSIRKSGKVYHGRLPRTCIVNVGHGDTDSRKIPVPLSGLDFSSLSVRLLDYIFMGSGEREVTQLRLFQSSTGSKRGSLLDEKLTVDNRKDGKYKVKK